MAVCRIPGCRKEATNATPYTFSRFGPMSDSKPALNGYVPSGAVCPDHAVQALSMHRRFKKAGIGHDAGVVLLKLDKRERPFAQH